MADPATRPPEEGRQDCRGGRPSPFRALVIGVTCTLLGGLPLWLVASLAPQLRQDLGIDETGLGMALGLSFLVSALAAVPLGRLVDRLGWRWGAAGAAAVAAAVLLAIGTVARSPGILLLLLAFGALAVSLSHPAANIGISRAIPPGRQGLAFGVKQASVPLTTLVAGLSAPLVMHTIGWRVAFVGAAAVAFGFLVSVLVTGDGDQSGRAQTPAGGPGVAPMLMSDRLGRWPLTVLACGAGLVSGATVSLGGFLVLFAVASGMGQDGAGYLLAVGSSVGVVARILSGHLADRRGWDHLTTVAIMMAGGSAGFVTLAVGGPRWVLVVGTLVAFGLGWSWNGLFALSIVLRNSDAPGSATGAVQTGLCLGATIGPVLFGLTVSTLSYSVAWSAAAVVTLCGAGFILLGLGMQGSRCARRRARTRCNRLFPF